MNENLHYLILRVRVKCNNLLLHCLLLENYLVCGLASACNVLKLVL